MTSIIVPRGVGDPLRAAAACLAIAVASPTVGRAATACETPPDLHIEVMAKFDVAPVRNDYTLADIIALAHQQRRDAGRALLGFYASEFGYTIDVEPEGDRACPARIETIVTLRLQHRLIEIGQEAVTNVCVYPGALRHYRRLAETDEQTVARFVEIAATTLSQASDALRDTRAANAEDLDAALRDQVHAIVDKAIMPLHSARQDAQQAVNNAGELRQLASSCSI